jgi:LPXTG-motif cell wall-anchored protein
MALRIALLAAIAAALAVPTAASAGGWATVGFDPPPGDLAPGEPWRVDLEVLQHGRTPLVGVNPRVIVQPTQGGEQESFLAKPTDEPGVYRATVVFASAGTWMLSVDDDFAARHSFPAVQVGNGGKRAAEEPVAAVNAAAAAPPSTGGDGPNLLLAFGAAAIAALAAGLGAAYLQRRLGGTTPAQG